MKTKIVILTEPKQWNFTDQNTGVYRSGISAVCFLPGEGVIQSFSNFPAGVENNKFYSCDIGLQQKTGANGKMESSLKLVALDLATAKGINWDSILK